MNDWEDRKNGQHEIVDRVTKQVKSVLSRYKEVYAAILMGSCSRGEESYYEDENGVQMLLSDYEFTVVTKKKKVPKAVDQALKELNMELKNQMKSPFFNMEWNFVWKRKLPLMDKRFINFEMAEAKCLICGNENVFSLFPKIQVSNLNFSELDSIVNHRLYHVLKDFYTISERQQKYLIARNTLDILSVVLPYEGKLICSYSKRLEQFPESLIGKGFSDDILIRLQNCLKMKMNYSSTLYDEIIVDNMLYAFIQDMQALHEYQKAKQGGKAFRIDKRRLIRSVIKLRLHEMKKVLERPEKEEELYQDMMKALRQKNADYIDFSSRISELYGYQ